MYTYKMQGQSEKEFIKWLDRKMQESGCFPIPKDEPTYLRYVKEWFNELGIQVDVYGSKPEFKYTYRIKYNISEVLIFTYDYTGEPYKLEKDAKREAFEKAFEIYDNHQTS